MTRSDYNGVGALLGLAMLSSLALLPLGIWKLVEIIIWIWHHDPS